jgi:hypothetical protein
MTIFRYVTLITAQNDFHCSLCTIMRFSQIICYLSDNAIISPNVVSRIHDSLPEFLFAFNFSWYITVVVVIVVASKETGREVNADKTK